MPLTYRDAGVDINAGDQFVDEIGPLVASTLRPEVVGSLGGFSGLFALDPKKYKSPLLVASTDGVGTKLKIANVLNEHTTVGIDLVAMVVNDIIVTGAEPLFFLDYFATGALSVDQGKQVLIGIAEGCRQAGCALLGGETAEMPGFYAKGEYDLAGFGVGVVERDLVLGRDRVKAGDVLVGLASTGFHSNGYSLVRKVFLDKAKSDLSATPPGLTETLGQALLKPTRIYVKLVLDLLRKAEVHGLAHITGSGIPGNLPRVFSDLLRAEVVRGSWTVPPIFKLLQQAGEVPEDDMWSTFNLGLGMIAAVPQAEVEATRKVAREHGVESWVVGKVVARAEGAEPFALVNPK